MPVSANPVTGPSAPALPASARLQALLADLRRASRGESQTTPQTEQDLDELGRLLLGSTNTRGVAATLNILGRGEGQGIYERVLDVAEVAAPSAYANALLDLAAGPTVDHPWFYIALMRAMQSVPIQAQVTLQAARRPYPQRKRLKAQIERFLGQTPSPQRELMTALCLGL